MKAHYDYQKMNQKLKSRHRVRLIDSKINLELSIGYFKTKEEAKAAMKAVNKVVNVLNIGGR